MYSLLLALHLVAIFGLVGSMFFAYASVDSTSRKAVLMWSGIAALLALLTGLVMVGTLATAGLDRHGWIAVKFFCWLVIAAVPGICYRKREKAQQLFVIGCGAVVLAILMVVFKPF